MGDDRKASPGALPAMTLPGVLKASCSTYGKKPWMRKKQAGLWHEYSWCEGCDRIRYFSLGLTGLGFRPGQSLGIIGDSDPHWFWAEIAAQAAGGSALGLSRTWSPEDIAAALRQFDVRFVVVADREQVDKLLQVRDSVPSLARVIYWNARAIEADQERLLISFDRVAEAGRKADSPQSSAFDERVAQVKGSDVAIARCEAIDGSNVRSSTLTHEALLTAVEGLRSTYPFDAEDRWFSCTQAEGTVEQTMGLAGSLTSGMSIDFPENQQTTQQDLREVGSTLVCYPSVIWEALTATLKDRIEKTTFVKRVLAKMAAPAGSSRADARLKGIKPGPFPGVHGALAEFTFYRPLKARIGLANARCVYALGDELTPGTMKALLGMGLNVVELDVSGETVRIRQTSGRDEATRHGQS